MSKYTKEYIISLENKFVFIVINTTMGSCYRYGYVFIDDTSDNTWLYLYDEEKSGTDFNMSLNIDIDIDNILYIKDAPISNREKKLEAIADIFSRIWYYGEGEVETLNEKALISLIESVGYLPTTEDDIIERPSLDEYMINSKEYISVNKSKYEIIKSNIEKKYNADKDKYNSYCMMNNCALSPYEKGILDTYKEILTLFK